MSLPLAASASTRASGASASRPRAPATAPATAHRPARAPRPRWSSRSETSTSESSRLVAGARRRDARPSPPTRTSDAADGVVPAFGEEAAWPLVHADLKSGKFGKVRTVSVADAKDLMARGASLADVRPRIEFEEFHAGVDEDNSLDVRNVPYMVRTGASPSGGRVTCCAPGGLKERDWNSPDRSRSASPTSPRPSSWDAKPAAISAWSPYGSRRTRARVGRGRSYRRGAASTATGARATR